MPELFLTNLYCFSFHVFFLGCTDWLLAKVQIRLILPVVKRCERVLDPEEIMK